MRRDLLPFIFVLILTFQTLNMQWYAGTENTNSMTIHPSDRAGEIERNHNDSRGTYRDGIVDNFDNFTNPGFPTEYGKFCFRYNSCQLVR